MTFWDRLFVACLFAGTVLLYERTHRNPAVDFDPLVIELENIREELANVQASRCLVINTPTLDIYQVPNLGTKKVSKP